MKKELEKTYDPSKTEQETYKTWCERGYFLPREKSAKGAYTIVIPPPNVTGKLHMGHALDETLQDTLIRFSLMATHTKEQVEYALETIQKVFRKYQLIP